MTAPKIRTRSLLPKRASAAPSHPQSDKDRPPTPPPPLIKHTVVVIHADTYAGHYVARHLVQDPKLHVRITARRRESVEELERLGCELHILRDFPPNPQDLDSVYAGANSTVLIPPMVRDLDKIVKAHVDACARTGEPTPHIAATAIDDVGNHGVQHLVFVSAIRADRGYPTADPWAALDRAESSVRDFKLPSGTPASTIFRTGYLQQSLVTFAELFRARAVLPLPIGIQAQVAPVNLKDVASAVRSVIHGGRRSGNQDNLRGTTQDENPRGKTFKLTGPHALTGEHMARVASDQLGFEIVFVDIKDKNMRQILGTLPGITDEEVEAHMATFKDIRDGYHNTVSEDLEYLLPRPPESLAQFFHENANQFRPEMAKAHSWQWPQVETRGDPLTRIILGRRR